MTIKLQCRKCGSRNTIIVSAEELSNKIGDKSILTAATCGTLTLADLEIIEKIAEAIKEIFKTLGELLGLIKEKKKEKKKNKQLVLVCKDCGYWEKI